MSDNQMEMMLATGGKLPEAIALEMEILLGCFYPNKWATRKDLATHGLTDRQCRMGRQHSKGRIIAGQLGYKLAKHATLEELRQAANTLHSQATAMLREEQELWRVLHGRGEAEERKEA